MSEICPNPDDLEGKRAQLEIRASRRPANGSNVVGRVGADRAPRLVCFAHVDAKDGTPGALDNASGVVILLLLAEMLQDYQGRLGLELVAMNGEDYYAASGEVAYVENNRHRFGEIVLGVNIDGAGYRHGSTAYSLYGCPDGLTEFCSHGVCPLPGIDGRRALVPIRPRAVPDARAACACHHIGRHA